MELIKSMQVYVMRQINGTQFNDLCICTDTCVNVIRIEINLPICLALQNFVF